MDISVGERLRKHAGPLDPDPDLAVGMVPMFALAKCAHSFTNQVQVPARCKGCRHSTTLWRRVVAASGYLAQN